MKVFLKKTLSAFQQFTKTTKSTYYKSKNFYYQKIHNQVYAPLVYAFLVLLLLALAIFLNIIFMAQGKYSLSQITWVLEHWEKMEENILNISPSAFNEIKRGWYSVFATLIAGIGMTLSAISAQSLTRNPLAEGSTLGLIQAAIFGVIFSIWLQENLHLFAVGISEILAKFGFAIIFAIVNALFLILFILTSKRMGSASQKIILAGLAIGIIFKTLTFIFKAQNGNLNVVSYTMVLGGAEAVASQPLTMRMDDMGLSLIIASVAIGLALILAVINIKGMNLLEIGDERAKNLGASIYRTRILNVLIVLLSLPASVILVGNMAFLGLFAIHSARWLSKSRNYQKVLPVSLIVGMLMASLGLQLTSHLPQVNSGIWMTFIGAPYLIYIGLRGLK